MTKIYNQVTVYMVLEPRGHLSEALARNALMNGALLRHKNPKFQAFWDGAYVRALGDESANCWRLADFLGANVATVHEDFTHGAWYYQDYSRAEVYIDNSDMCQTDTLPEGFVARRVGGDSGMWNLSISDEWLEAQLNKYRIASGTSTDEDPQPLVEQHPQVRRIELLGFDLEDGKDQTHLVKVYQDEDRVTVVRVSNGELCGSVAQEVELAALQRRYEDLKHHATGISIQLAETKEALTEARLEGTRLLQNWQESEQSFKEASATVRRQGDRLERLASIVFHKNRKIGTISRKHLQAVWYSDEEREEQEEADDE